MVEVDSNLFIIILPLYLHKFYKIPFNGGGKPVRIGIGMAKIDKPFFRDLVMLCYAFNDIDNFVFDYDEFGKILVKKYFTAIQ